MREFSQYCLYIMFCLGGTQQVHMRINESVEGGAAVSGRHLARKQRSTAAA